MQLRFCRIWLLFPKMQLEDTLNSPKMSGPPCNTKFE